MAYYNGIPRAETQEGIPKNLKIFSEIIVFRVKFAEISDFQKCKQIRRIP